MMGYGMAKAAVHQLVKRCMNATNILYFDEMIHCESIDHVIHTYNTYNVLTYSDLKELRPMIPLHSLACPGSGLPSSACALGLLPVTLDTPMNRKFMPDADQ